MKCLHFFGAVSVAMLATGSMVAPTLFGGYGNEEAPTPYVNELFKNVRLQLIHQWDRTVKSGIASCEDLEPVVVSYISQVVAGTNYIMKVEMCPGVFIAAKVFEPLPYMNDPPQLMKIVRIESGQGLSSTVFTD